jgi:N-acetylmuramoyl-L-alanine amidase
MEITVADGVFGKGTDKAVRAFQTSKQLVADGLVGAVTMKNLA